MKHNSTWAFQQTGRLCDFFDGVYIASDKPEHIVERNWQDKRIGLLLIKNGKITEKKCKPLLNKPRHSALVMLRKYGMSKDILAPLVPADTAEEKDDHD